MSTDPFSSQPSGFDQKTGPAAFGAPAAPSPAAGEPDVSTPSAPDVTERLQALETENAQLKDQALRALAEAENTRRRAERDREDASKFGITNFARGLLNVADNLRRALDAIPADLRDGDPRLQALIAGIEATERELLSGFERVGIKKIAALETLFNANLHEVMFEAPGTGKSPGTVVQVIEDGYTIHERLLRPARVGVAKGDGPTPRTIDQQV